jgi:hypothetical protein
LNSAVLSVILIYLILGANSGLFVSGVAENVVKFARAVPEQSLRHRDRAGAGFFDRQSDALKRDPLSDCMDNAHKMHSGPNGSGLRVDVMFVRTQVLGTQPALQRGEAQKRFTVAPRLHT